MSHGQREVASQLLALGCDPDACGDCEGGEEVTGAMDRGHWREGPSVHIAARENDVVLLDLLVGYGANASAMVVPLGSPMHVGV